jgi:hypothetical protein
MLCGCMGFLWQKTAKDHVKALAQNRPISERHNLGVTLYQNLDLFPYHCLITLTGFRRYDIPREWRLLCSTCDILSASTSAHDNNSTIGGGLLEEFLCHIVLERRRLGSWVALPALGTMCCRYSTRRNYGCHRKGSRWGKLASLRSSSCI